MFVHCLVCSPSWCALVYDWHALYEHGLVTSHICRLNIIAVSLCLQLPHTSNYESYFTMEVVRLFAYIRLCFPFIWFLTVIFHSFQMKPPNRRKGVNAPCSCTCGAANTTKNSSRKKTKRPKVGVSSTPVQQSSLGIPSPTPDQVTQQMGNNTTDASPESHHGVSHTLPAMNSQSMASTCQYDFPNPSTSDAPNYSPGNPIPHLSSAAVPFWRFCNLPVLPFGKLL